MSYTANHAVDEQSTKIHALVQLIHLGYEFIQTKTCDQLRQHAHCMLLETTLRSYLNTQCVEFEGQNHPLSEENITHIVTKLMKLSTQGSLQKANQQLYHLLIYGVGVTEFIGHKKCHATIKLIDWEHPEENHFHVTEDFNVLGMRDRQMYHLDLVCFVNGLPWVMIDTTSEDSFMQSSVHDEDYATSYLSYFDEMPHFFAYNQLIIQINGQTGRYATCSAGELLWSQWQEQEFLSDHMLELKKKPLQAQHLNSIFESRNSRMRNYYQAALKARHITLTEQDRLMIGVLTPARLLEIVHLYTRFDRLEQRFIARYQQFFGIKQVLDQVAQFKKSGQRCGGLVWYAAGSGKSFMFLFLVHALLYCFRFTSCRLVVVSNQMDVSSKLNQHFHSSSYHQYQKKTLVRTGTELATKIGQGAEQLIFSSIRKFTSALTQSNCYNTSSDIIVLVDELYLLSPEDIQALQRQLPQAAYIAASGTPLEQSDQQEHVFGPLLYTYDVAQAIYDGQVLPLLYDERTLDLQSEKELDAWCHRMAYCMNGQERQSVKPLYQATHAQLREQGRYALIAQDICDHFQNVQPLGFQGLLVCEQISSAKSYHAQLQQMGQVSSYIVTSRADLDVQSRTQDPVDILIFPDTHMIDHHNPCYAVLYLDKVLSQHDLIYTMTHVNALSAYKKFGYIIDYSGQVSSLDMDQEEEYIKELDPKSKSLKDICRSFRVEYERLPDLYQAIWHSFTDCTLESSDQALVAALSPKTEWIDTQWIDLRAKKREHFYATFDAFTHCLHIAYASSTYHQDHLFDETSPEYRGTLRQHYQQTWLRMLEINQQTREEAKEPQDPYTISANSAFKQKHMHQIVQDPQHIPSSTRLAYLDEQKAPSLEQQMQQLIHRITEKIKHDFEYDRYAQDYFSESLRVLQEQIKSLVFAPEKHYQLLIDFEVQVQNKDIHDLPEALKEHQQARIYFGLFKQYFAREDIEADVPHEAKLTELAFHMDQVVQQAIQEFSVVPAEMEKYVRRHLVVPLFDCLGKEGAQTILSDVLALLRKLS
tara:strand:+ start:5700 stop:8822 length:3123 start_codon:yes stop_codon:yes gene_type:complete